MGRMDIKRLQTGDEAVVLAAGELFDGAPSRDWTRQFLSTDNHHLLVALSRELPVGFVTGVETVHPDKGTEMFLYELSVHPGHRHRGIGTALVKELAALARRRGCYGMWVLTEAVNPIALATYRAAGASAPESVLSLQWRFDDVPTDPGAAASN